MTQTQTALYHSHIRGDQTAVLIRDGGSEQRFTAEDAKALRRDMLQHLKTIAQDFGSPIELHDHGAGDVVQWRLSITPDGEVSALDAGVTSVVPPTAAPTPAPAPAMPTPAPAMPTPAPAMPAPAPTMPAPAPAMPTPADRRTDSVVQLYPERTELAPGVANRELSPNNLLTERASVPEQQPLHASPEQENPAPRRTRQDFIHAQPATISAPATSGWRGMLNRLTAGALRLSPSEAEQLHRDAIAGVQRSLDGPKQIVVINPKGGAHKTTATVMIGATFGFHRGGNVLAWDNNETEGSLVGRSLGAHHNNSTHELLRDLDRFNALEARFGDLNNYVRSQGDAKFDVLTSTDNPEIQSITSGEDFLALREMLARFYRIMVVDTGNNTRASNWEAAVETADQIVIVSTLREDTGRAAAGVADRLVTLGHERKLARGVTILSAPAESKDMDPGLSERLHKHFSTVTRDVVHVPFEREFVGGGPLELAKLSPATREAWLLACATIAEGLGD